MSRSRGPVALAKYSMEGYLRIAVFTVVCYILYTVYSTANLVLNYGLRYLTSRLLQTLLAGYSVYCLEYSGPY